MNFSVIKFCAIIAAPLLAHTPFASEARPSYDFRERTRALAFDPGTFFQGHPKPWMSVVYSGDDYGFPVYSIAIRKGCTRDDVGEARRACGNRLTARMVRAPFQGTPHRPRYRGQALFGALNGKAIADDTGLRTALSQYGLEWLEADVTQCAPAMDLLGKTGGLSFFVEAPVPRVGPPPPVVLHADTITLEYRGGYLVEARYFGWVAPGSPGEWADRFAQSLEGCWRQAQVAPPWEGHPRP